MKTAGGHVWLHLEIVGLMPLMWSEFLRKEINDIETNLEHVAIKSEVMDLW